MWTGSNRRPPVCKAEESIPTTTLVIQMSHRLQQFGDLLSLNSYPNALKTFDFVHSWCTAYSAYTRLDLHPLRCLLNVCVDDAFFVALSGFSFLSETFGFLSRGLHEIGRRRSFERQSVANFPHDALLQRLNKVDAGVAARNFRSLQVELGQFPRPTECFTVRHNFGNHSPFICGTRRERLWVQQECLRSSCSRAITPGGKDSVAGRNARGEMGHILEGRTLRRHNYTGKQRVV